MIYDGEEVTEDVKEGEQTPYKPPPDWIERLNSKLNSIKGVTGKSPLIWALDDDGNACLKCVAVHGKTEWRHWVYECNTVLSIILKEDYPNPTEECPVPFIRPDGSAHVYELVDAEIQDIGILTFNSGGTLFERHDVAEVDEEGSEAVMEAGHRSHDPDSPRPLGKKPRNYNKWRPVMTESLGATFKRQLRM